MAQKPENKKVLYISVDIETDGPADGGYSMIELGAVVVEDGFKRTFFANLAPVSDKYQQSALDISHKTREQTLAFEDPAAVMKRFAAWVKDIAKDGVEVRFMADNGFDWSFVNPYLWKYCNENPFGHADFNLNSFIKGIYNNPDMSVRQLRDAELDHNALSDAIANAKVMLRLIKNNFKPLPKTSAPSARSAGKPPRLC